MMDVSQHKDERKVKRQLGGTDCMLPSDVATKKARVVRAADAAEKVTDPAVSAASSAPIMLLSTPASAVLVSSDTQPPEAAVVQPAEAAAVVPAPSVVKPPEAAVVQPAEVAAVVPAPSVVKPPEASH